METTSSPKASVWDSEASVWDSEWFESYGAGVETSPNTGSFAQLEVASLSLEQDAQTLFFHSPAFLAGPHSVGPWAANVMPQPPIHMGTFRPDACANPLGGASGYIHAPYSVPPLPPRTVDQGMWPDCSSQPSLEMDCFGQVGSVPGFGPASSSPWNSGTYQSLDALQPITVHHSPASCSVRDSDYCESGSSIAQRSITHMNFAIGKPRAGEVQAFPSSDGPTADGVPNVSRGAASKDVSLPKNSNSIARRRSVPPQQPDSSHAHAPCRGSLPDHEHCAAEPLQTEEPTTNGTRHAVDRRPGPGKVLKVTSVDGASIAVEEHAVEEHDVEEHAVEEHAVEEASESEGSDLPSLEEILESIPLPRVVIDSKLGDDTNKGERQEYSKEAGTRRHKRKLSNSPVLNAPRKKPKSDGMLEGPPSFLPISFMIAIEGSTALFEWSSRLKRWHNSRSKKAWKIRDLTKSLVYVEVSEGPGGPGRRGIGLTPSSLGWTGLDDEGQTLCFDKTEVVDMISKHREGYFYSRDEFP
ncbi:hypothetical protein EsDP_00006940 [Epichloe bromicola]|uniref:Uncharacterized protein n=1 Tax=Epichloe bromicola TaxID=79588 RepID=A0ABQ0CZ38_9HYPO